MTACCVYARLCVCPLVWGRGSRTSTRFPEGGFHLHGLRTAALGSALTPFRGSLLRSLLPRFTQRRGQGRGHCEEVLVHEAHCEY